MRATRLAGLAMAFAVIGASFGAVMGDAGKAYAGDGGGLQLVSDKPDPNVVRADVLYKAGVRAMKLEKFDRALSLFERALPWKNTSSDLYYNLVHASKALKLWDKVVLYAQGFLYREPGTKDSVLMRDELDLAFVELGKKGIAPVAHRFDVTPLNTPVLVNGVPVTASAAIEIRLLPGKYTVSATKEDWHAFTLPLVVAVGAPPQTVKGALTPVPAIGKVIIKTTPADGVKVFQDEVLVGTTPLAGPIELATGRRYLFRFEKDGYDRWWRYIEVFKGESLELTPVMEESPKRSAAR